MAGHRHTSLQMIRSNGNPSLLPRIMCPPVSLFDLTVCGREWQSTAFQRPVVTGDSTWN